ncbi:MAG: hypothetical protein RM347_011025 [Nostoc sp. ChiQUE02]
MDFPRLPKLLISVCFLSDVQNAELKIRQKEFLPPPSCLFALHAKENCCISAIAQIIHTPFKHQKP